MPRFVVLRHDVDDGFSRTRHSHFDWMFETASVLKTWATEPVKFEAPLISLTAESLADHRMLYLDFEGELSQQRGSVCRVIQGDYRLIENSPHRFVAELSWQNLDQLSFQRTLLIERLEDDSDGSWRLRLSE